MGTTTNKPILTGLFALVVGVWVGLRPEEELGFPGSRNTRKGKEAEGAGFTATKYL